jgi:hypothetical protein
MGFSYIDKDNANTALNSIGKFGLVPFRNKLSFNFNGTDQYANAGDVGSFLHTDSFSISFWIKISDVSNDLAILGRWIGSGTDQGWYIYINDTTGYPVFVFSGGTTNRIEVEFQVGIADGEWHNIIFTYTGSGSPAATDVNCYIDGIDRAANRNAITDAFSGSAEVSHDFYIGAIEGAGGSPGDFMLGYLKDIAVYTGVITSTGAANIFLGRTPRNLTLYSVPPVEDLLYYWRMGEGSDGVTISDGNIYGLDDGTATTVNFDAGDIVAEAPATRLSTSFDGVDQYLNAGNVCSFAHTDSFTVSFWIKGTDKTVDRAIIGRWDGVAGQGWYIYINDTTGYVVFVLSGGGGNRLEIEFTDVDLLDGDWHHVTITYEGNATPASIYVDCFVDGIDISSSRNAITDAFSGSSVVTDELHIGSVDTGAGVPGNFMLGYLDEICIFNSIQTSAFITYLYNSGSQSKPWNSNLLHYWGMGEFSDGTSIPDGQILNLDGDGSATTVNITAADFTSDVPEISVSTNFNGTDEYANAGDICSFAHTDSFSVSFWIKSSDKSDLKAIVGRWIGSGTDQGWYIYIDTNGYVTLVISGGGANRLEIEFQTDVLDGNWHHVVITYAGSAAPTSVGCYIDDSDVSGTRNTVTDAFSGSAEVSHDFYIGAIEGAGGSPDDFMLGYLDEICIFSSVLTSGFISTLYSNTSNAQPWHPNLLHYWRMGEDSDGSIIRDEQVLYLDGIGNAVTFNMDYINQEGEYPTPPSPFTTNLLCYLKLNDGPWTDAQQVDSTYTSNHGTAKPKGASLASVAGKFGTAASFAGNTPQVGGIQDYILIPDFTLGVGDPISFSVWFRSLEASVDSPGRIMSSVYSLWDSFFELIIDNSNAVSLVYGASVIALGTANPAEYNHAVVTIEPGTGIGGNDTVTRTFNGTTVTANNYATVGASGTYNTVLGARQYSLSAGGYHGYIDEVAIWENRALTTVEHASLWNGGTGLEI